jgi:polysaccharide biosynthesis-related protein
MLKRLLKDTTIYGIATVLPRVMTLLLTRLYVNKLDTYDFGIYSGIFAYIILGNVLLSYGMETAFFRFMNKDKHTKKVQSTALTSLTVTSLLFLALAYLLRESIASWLNYDTEHIVFAILILVFDSLVVIPFAWLRNNNKPLIYAAIKVGGTAINMLLNIYFLTFFSEKELYMEAGVTYIFLSNVIASLLTLIVLIPVYVKIRFSFSYALWREMMLYAFPVLLAGIAFAINEGFDRVFLRMLLPKETADTTIGVYSACYKMGTFMNLFVTAYKLGVEPFFFSTAKDKNAKKNYAKVTEYFTIFGGFFLLFITVFTNVFKHILIPNEAYWEALWIVPIILLANLCLGIYHSLSVWYKVTDNTKFGAIFSIIGMLVTIVFNFTLIPLFSYKGAALATLAAYASMMFLSYYYGQKYYHIPYRQRILKFFLGISILFSFVEFYLFNVNIFTGILLLVIYGYLANLIVDVTGMLKKRKTASSTIVK